MKGLSTFVFNGSYRMWKWCFSLCFSRRQLIVCNLALMECVIPCREFKNTRTCHYTYWKVMTSREGFLGTFCTHCWSIWWPCSSGASMAVSRTSDGASVYGSQHNEWSKVWFKWSRPDPSNCSPLSVITTLCWTSYRQQAATGLLSEHCAVWVWFLSAGKHFFLYGNFFSVKWHIWRSA